MRSASHNQHCCQHSRSRPRCLIGNASLGKRASTRLQAVQAEQTRTHADLMSLVPWAIKAGIQFAKIKPAVQPDSGRGLVATADIQPGECVVNVPTAAAIRVYPGCPTVFQIPSNMWEALPWYGQLALTLLHEAQLGPASKWADYIKQLPTAVDVPVLWSDQEVQQLSCSYIISQVQQQRREWAELQQQVAPYLSQAGVGADQLKWALSVTRSRTFAAPYVSNPFGAQLGWLSRQAGQQQQQHVLCPLLDLFNHSGEVQSECEFYSDFRSSAFRVVASQAWRRGQQVLINYGSGSNDALLQLYGFVEQGNRDDRYIVRCLPKVLQEQGHVISTGAIENLAEVVITRQGCDMSAAVQLSQLLSEQAPSPTAAQDSVVPYNALASRVRSVCAAALLQELIMLGVDAAADEWVLQAFAELPAKEAELAGKQTDLAKVQNRLQTLQQMLQEAQHSSTAAPEEEAQHESQQVQTESVEHSGAAADAAQSAQAQLESTIGLCLQMSGQLESQVAELQALLDHWHGLVQQNKQLAVTYRLQKHALLMHVLEQLNNA